MFFLCNASYHTLKKQFSFQIILSVSTDCSKQVLCKQNDIFLDVYNHTVNKYFSSLCRWSGYTRIKWAQSHTFPISKILWSFKNVTWNNSLPYINVMQKPAKLMRNAVVLSGMAWLHSSSTASLCYSCRGIERSSLRRDKQIYGHWRTDLASHRGGLSATTSKHSVLVVITEGKV